MPRPIDLSGRRFGRLTVTTQAGRRKIGSQVKRFWRCRCDCGAEIEKVNGETLTAAEWARRAGLSKRALLYRLDAGWPLAHALTYPADRRVQHR